METTIISRRRTALAVCSALLMGSAFGGAVFVPSSSAWAGDHRSATVYRSPSCGCCGGWIDYLEGHGFDVAVNDVDDPVAVKQIAGVPEELYSCHTAAIDGYTIEGHVPVEAIERLLEERPDVQGIGVAGMPAGSPGMGGQVREPYTAYTFEAGEVRDPFMTFTAAE